MAPGKALQPVLRMKVDELFLRWLSEPGTQRLLHAALRRLRAHGDPRSGAGDAGAAAGAPPWDLQPDLQPPRDPPQPLRDPPQSPVARRFDQRRNTRLGESSYRDLFRHFP